MEIRWKPLELLAPSVFAALVLLFFPTPGSAGERAAPCPAGHGGAKPNLIFILTDDQDLLLGSMAVMPNVQSLLVDQGATFTDFFVPLSQCCPSRTSTLRGQYPHSHKIWTNEPPDGGFQKAYADNVEQETVATALHAAGYRTFLFGKYLNGYPATASDTYIPPGWDDWYSPTAGDPYGEFNYTLNENGTPVSYGSAPADYLTDVMSARAVEFIRNLAGGSSPPPFFMHLTTFAPHKPFTPAPRDADLFPGAQAPRTPSFNEADVSDKPAYVQALPLLTAQDIQTLDDEYRLRLQSLQAVDDMVGALVQALQAANMLDNTYIFFGSDNGFHMGQHRFLAGKYTPYETDIRVPLVVRGPGIPAGLTVGEFAGNVDLATTLAELGGTVLTETSDGRSLLPLLSGQTPSTWRNVFLLEQIYDPASSGWTHPPTDRQAEPPDPQDLKMTPGYPGHKGFRAATYKYVEYDTGEREVYYLNSDPDEMVNQASVASPTFLASASAYLATLASCKGSGCLAAEEVQPPSPVAPSFTMFPAAPTDATPVTFTASADGTPPYVFTWDLGGQAAEGQTVTRSFVPGTYAITLTVQDAAGAVDVSSGALTVSHSVMITGVKALPSPFRLVLQGTGFASGCLVAVDGAAVPRSVVKSATKIQARGQGLKAMVPKGRAVQVTAANPDGVPSAPYAFTR